MYKSQALLLISIPLVLLAISSVLYGVVFTASKLENKADRTKFEINHKPWFEEKSHKVVLIVIDALRFDLLINQGEDPDIPEGWEQHQLFNFMDALKKNPDNSVIFKAYVDAPTLTTARVPSMMSGNFPLKASNFHHFGGLPVTEDNLLYQAKKAGRKIYYGGDPLWPTFYPNEFIDSLAIRGYDIKSADVDDEAFDFLWNIFDNKEFDFLIGHLLGIDHIAHSAGFNNPLNLIAKNKVEKFLMELMEKIDDDTTLIVMGDHGATLAGEHGKDSYGETHVPIVGYNKKGFQANRQHNLKEILKNVESGRTIKQVDIVPTLASIMGVPIPFSNFGSIINDLSPAHKFPVPEHCPEKAFELQVLYNNYANSVQIKQYLEEKQAQTQLFPPKTVQHLEDMFKKEIDPNYKKLITMFEDPQQCKQTDELLISTVLKAQEFSDKIDDLVKNTNAYDFFITASGILGVALILLAYMLLSKVLKFEGYERQNTIKIRALCTKKALPLYGVLAVAGFVPYVLTKDIAYSFTVCCLLLQFWYCGSIAASYIKIRQSQGNRVHRKVPSDVENPQESENSTASPTLNLPANKDNYDDDGDFAIAPENKVQQIVGYMKSLYEASPLKRILPKTSIYNYAAFGTVAFTLYLTYAYDLAEVRRGSWIKNAPVTAFFVIGCLLASNLRPFFGLIMIANITVCSIIYFGNIGFYTWTKSVPLGLFIASEFFLKEVYFMLTKLKTTKIMAAFQLSSMGVLFYYLKIKNQGGYNIDILMPRIIWVLLLGSIIAGKIQKIERPATKRNFQFCVVVFIYMLRIQKQVLHFAILLQVMNLTTQLFQKANVKNKLFPVVMGALGYLGLYYVYMTDRYVPFTFVPAFTGLTDFNPVLVPVFYMMYLLASFILSTIFVSRYNQHLALAAENSSAALPEIKSEGTKVKDGSQVAKIVGKRNVFPLVIFYAVLVIGACVETLYLCVTNKPFTFERFLLDAMFYLYVLGCGIFFL